MTTYRAKATLTAHDDGYSVYDWFECDLDNHVLDRKYATPEGAETALSSCYRGPDVDGVEATWEIFETDPAERRSQN